MSCPQQQWREEMEEFSENMKLWERKVVGTRPCHAERGYESGSPLARENQLLRAEIRHLREVIENMKVCRLPISFAGW